MIAHEDSPFPIKDEKSFSDLFDYELFVCLDHSKRFIDIHLVDDQINEGFSERHSTRRQHQIFFLFLLFVVAIIHACLQWNYLRPISNEKIYTINRVEISLLQNNQNNNLSNAAAESINKNLVIDEQNTLLNTEDKFPPSRSSESNIKPKAKPKELHSSLTFDLQKSIQEVSKNYIWRDEQKNNNTEVLDDTAKTSLGKRLVPFDENLSKLLNDPKTVRLNQRRFSNSISATEMSFPDGYGNMEKSYFMIGSECYYSSPPIQDGYPPTTKKISCDQLFSKEKITRDSIIKK